MRERNVNCCTEKTMSCLLFGRVSFAGITTKDNQTTRSVERQTTAFPYQVFCTFSKVLELLRRLIVVTGNPRYSLENNEKTGTLSYHRSLIIV